MHNGPSSKVGTFEVEVLSPNLASKKIFQLVQLDAINVRCVHELAVSLPYGILWVSTKQVIKEK